MKDSMGLDPLFCARVVLQEILLTAQVLKDEKIKIYSEITEEDFKEVSKLIYENYHRQRDVQSLLDYCVREYHRTCKHPEKFESCPVIPCVRYRHLFAV